MLEHFLQKGNKKFYSKIAFSIRRVQIFYNAGIVTRDILKRN
jgi:hypothetical protein